MSDRVWVNPRQPQTLYLAQILMYFRGAMLLFQLLLSGNVELLGSTTLFSAYLLLGTLGLIAAANGIANENKWGFQLGIVAAFAPLVVIGIRIFDGGGDVLSGNIIAIMFDVALVALLLHPMSVNYRRTWFR